MFTHQTIRGARDMAQFLGGLREWQRRQAMVTSVAVDGVVSFTVFFPVDAQTPARLQDGPVTPA